MKKFVKIKNQKRTNHHLTFVLFTALFLVLAACGPSAPPVVETEEPETAAATEEIPPTAEIQETEADEAYPPPPPTIEFPAADEAYPIDPPPPTAVPTPTLESYPAEEELFAEPRFRLDQPLQPGLTTVTGQAPPDLPLAIVDVTYNGIVLGTGVSDADGNFSIAVSELPAGNRIGITFAQLLPGKTLIEMSEEYFPHRGEGFMNLPNVGIYFDTAMVEQ